LGQHITDLLRSEPSADLRSVVATAIGQVTEEHSLVPGESPASTVAIARWDDRHIDGLALGDSPIVALGRDGGVDVLRDRRHETVVAELRREARQTTEGLNTLDDLIRATRPAKLARMNRDGGYWIAEATPEAGHHAILRRWPVDSIHAVAAMTDGVSCGVEEYGVPPSWSAALTLALNDGLQALLALIHDAEVTDKDRQRWPRPKTHDDKAAALVVSHMRTRPGITSNYRSSTAFSRGR
jgi:Protein phosphatase 2C